MIGKTGTIETVGEHLLVKVVHILVLKPEMGKEPLLLSEGIYFKYTKCHGLTEARFHQFSTKFLASVLRQDYQRTDLRQILPNDIQGTATDDSVIFLDHHKIPEMGIQLTE